MRPHLRRCSQLDESSSGHLCAIQSIADLRINPSNACGHLVFQIRFQTFGLNRLRKSDPVDVGNLGQRVKDSLYRFLW